MTMQDIATFLISKLSWLPMGPDVLDVAVTLSVVAGALVIAGVLVAHCLYEVYHAWHNTNVVRTPYIPDPNAEYKGQLRECTWSEGQFVTHVEKAPDYALPYRKDLVPRETQR